MQDFYSFIINCILGEALKRDWSFQIGQDMYVMILKLLKLRVGGTTTILMKMLLT